MDVNTRQNSSGERRTRLFIDRYIAKHNWPMTIAGKPVMPVRSETLAVRNPANGEQLASVPVATFEEVKQAMQAAATAYPRWRACSAEKRSLALYSAAERISQEHESLALLETLENGKPIAQSRMDVENAVRIFRFYAGALDKFYGHAVRNDAGEMAQIVFEPHGVVVAIIPWNWPPMHTADFLALPLAAGNTVVLKSAPDTPLSSLRMAEILCEVFPSGAINVLTGGGDIGEHMVKHPDTAFVAFTGSDRTGARILAAAAERIVPCMMELGGKNASVVFDDATVEDAVAGVLKSIIFNSGQACAGTERIYVQASVYERFVAELASAIEKVVVGPGDNERSEVGPLINEAQRMRVCGFLDRAKKAGCEVLAQANRPEDKALENGHWMAPTLLGGARETHPIMREEIFGPIACVATFESEEEVTCRVNASAYGLTASVWTRDLARAHRMSSAIEAGLVTVNVPNSGEPGLPFGGYKRSGIGRKQDFLESLRTFSRVKTVKMRWG